MPRSDPAQNSSPPPRSSWEAMVGACAKTLSRANPIEIFALPHQRLDSQLARCVRHNDTASFHSLLRSIEPSSFGSPALLNRALNDALRDDKAYFLNHLLSAGANPDSLTDGRPHRLVPADYPLASQAAWRGQPQALEALLRAGANPDLRNARGQTPLMIAAAAGSLDCARLLIQAGADLDALDSFGRNALHESLHYSLAQDPWSRAHPHPLALTSFAAGLRAKTPIAKALLEAGADASAPPPPNPRHSDEPPLPLLACALRVNDAPLADSLVSQGAPRDWLERSPPPGFVPSNRLGSDYFLFLTDIHADLGDLAPLLARLRAPPAPPPSSPPPDSHPPLKRRPILRASRP